MTKQTQTFSFKLSINDFIASIAFAVILLIVFHGIAYFKFSELKLPAIVYLIALISALSPLVAPLVHKKSAVRYDGSSLYGYDFDNNRICAFLPSDIQSFGIQKGVSRMNPRNHFATKDHIYINLSKGTIRSYLRSPTSDNLLIFLSTITGRKPSDLES